MAECPLCEEYSGTEESVEAHISSKSDEDHQGEIGKDYRGQMKSVGESVSEKVKGVVGSGSDSEDSDPDDGSNESMAEGSAKEAKTDTGEEDDGELSFVVIGALALIFWRALTSNNNRGRF